MPGRRPQLMPHPLRLQKSGFMPDNEPENGRWYWMDVLSMAQFCGADPILVDLAMESTPPSGWPLGGQTRINIRNEHMSYIITWYTLSAAMVGMWAVSRRKPATPLRRLPPVSPPKSG